MIEIDTRGMSPPEPFERVVDALRTMPAGETVVMILDREPIPLYRFLLRNGYRYETRWTDPQRCEVRIWEP